MLKLSKNQIGYLNNHAPDLSKTHRYNVIAAIRKKFRDISDFLIEITPLRYSEEFEKEFLKLQSELTQHITWIQFQ